MSLPFVKIILLSFYLFLLISLILLINYKPPGKNLKAGQSSKLAGPNTNPPPEDGTVPRQPTKKLSPESRSDSDKSSMWNLTGQSRQRNNRRRPPRPIGIGAVPSTRVSTGQYKPPVEPLAVNDSTTRLDLPLETEFSSGDELP
jgi:hypothetical protein